MPSMQEALADAIEHPLAAPRRPTGHKRAVRKKTGDPTGATLSWGVLGAVFGSLMVYGLYRGLSKLMR